jgi:hypothetical protein
VYWVAGTLGSTNKLPDNSQLLGAFIPSVALALPANATTQTGVLVLYSLADNEMVDVSGPVQFNNPP